MIESKRARLIIRNWIKQSKEFKECTILHAELEKSLTKMCNEVLTDDENEYVRLMGIDYVKVQGGIDIDSYSRILGEEHNDYYGLCACWRLIDGSYRTIYENFPELTSLLYIVPPSGTTYLFDPSAEKTVFKEEHKRYSEFFKEFDKKFLEYITVVKKLSDKMEAISNVVFSRGASLRVLRTEFEELYNLGK